MNGDPSLRSNSEHSSATRSEVLPAASEAEAIARRACCALEHGDIDNALTHARSALAADSACREALLVMAELSLRARNGGLAQKVLTGILRQNPNDLRAKNLLRRT